MDRRDFLRAGLWAAPAVLAGGAGLGASVLGPGGPAGPAAKGGLVRPPWPAHPAPGRPSALLPGTTGFLHSVCRWPYRTLELDELARGARRIGISSVELLEPEEWPVVQARGLVCALSNAPGEPRTRLTHGFNRVEHHEWLIPAYRERIALAAASGVPMVICFSGNRDGLSDEEGLRNCERGIRAIVPDAERHGVTVVMELLNSKVDHRDYQCDRTPWGAEQVRRVGSERFRLLYDIYHMQIMEGDVIRTIRENARYIAHYHTGGVPGRNEIDEAQELNYRAIARAIHETGFRGWIGQEFIPTRDPLTSLAEAVEICTVETNP
jgi:hydroxypyruvate isomerase